MPIVAAPCHRPPRLGAALSLGIHAVALVWLVQTATVPMGGAPPPSSLRMTIVNDPSPEEMARPAVEPEPPQAPAAGAESPPKPIPTARTLTKPPSPRKPQAPAPEPVGPEPANAATVTNEPADDRSTTANSPDVSTAAPAEAEDSSLRLYGMTVWARIMEHKPPGIHRRGTVGLTFSLSPAGGLITAEISASSGSDILDQAALAALREAAPFPPPPETASARQRTFSIPFQFR